MGGEGILGDQRERKDEEDACFDPSTFDLDYSVNFGESSLGQAEDSRRRLGQRYDSSETTVGGRWKMYCLRQAGPAGTNCGYTRYSFLIYEVV